jgi:glycerol kinase
MKTLLAIDQGTTSSRAILFSDKGEILSVQQKELKLYYPEKGWVEQDPRDIWRDTLWVCEEIIGETKEEIAAIGITNQRETTILWDRETGEPVYNAIVWQDSRTADYCSMLKEKGHEDIIRAKTGLLLDPYFAATKITWILDHVEGARERADAGKLAFGTVDSFLLWNLTQGKVHKTDITNASRTMIYNIVEQNWDEDLLQLFDIPKSLLPDVCDNCHDFGVADIKNKKLPISGIAGDQQAAFIGQACFQKGMVKSTYGTGCFALMNIGGKFIESKNRLLTTVAYRVNGKITYALEGSIFVAGAAVQWLRDNLNFFTDAQDSEVLAESVENNNGVYFVPAFTGLGAPYWDPNAQAAIFGLTRESNKAHITRAALEAQAFQTHDLMRAFSDDTGINIDVLRVDGGLVMNKFMCQFLSDILNIAIDVPKIIETTALGAAYLAGLQSGIFKNFDDISDLWKKDRDYKTSLDDKDRQIYLCEWSNAVQSAIKFSEK